MREENRTTLRFTVLGVALAQTFFWLYLVIIASKRVNNIDAGPDETMPAILATPAFVLLTLPALVLALADRWLILAAVLAVLGAIFTPLDVWQRLFGAVP